MENLSFETQTIIRESIVHLEDYKTIETNATRKARIQKQINELRKLLPEFQPAAIEEYRRTR